MEPSMPPLINRKRSLSLLASFSALLLLSLYLNQGRRLSFSLLSSLRSFNATASTAPISPISGDPPFSGAPLSPHPQFFQETLTPSNIALSPVPSALVAPSPAPAPAPSVNWGTERLEEEKAEKQQLAPEPRAFMVPPPPLDGTVERAERLKEEKVEGFTEKCDVFDGRWVYDRRNYPLYHGYQCPFLSEQVNCQKNGRPDSDYEHWRWEAKGCEIPRFNGTFMLEKLRGKRFVMVGDSLNRNQWESLVCLLYSSIRPSRATIKTRPYRIFRAKDYDCSVEFYWSPFLVQMEQMKEQNKVIKLEKLTETSRRWQGADIMFFNTGHWWTHHGSFKSWKYYEYRGQLVEEMKEHTAFKIAMKTWARWIDRRVDPMKTIVFFRSHSPVHKRTNLEWCYNQTRPITNEIYAQWFPRSLVSIIDRTIQKMRTPVKYLNITRLSEYRRDAHTSVYTTRHLKLLTKEQQNQPEIYADCDHWCLPGLPDTWNVLLYAYIIGTPSILS